VAGALSPAASTFRRRERSVLPPRADRDEFRGAGSAKGWRVLRPFHERYMLYTRCMRKTYASDSLCSGHARCRSSGHDVECSTASAASQDISSAAAASITFSEALPSSVVLSQSVSPDSTITTGYSCTYRSVIYGYHACKYNDSHPNTHNVTISWTGNTSHQLVYRVLVQSQCFGAIEIQMFKSGTSAVSMHDSYAV
jgi:hypothetical protein